ncbi:vWA domain-containing protein [Pelobacter seleniigenes]|uniref:vWA domain-containing protein n=1 Tax=Pelobacter seleniigenes TaxID=407188 RepID=UPI001FE0520C|nr:VWA-like domain-containing protein [Pelobacter seleniigenes]
MTIQFSTPSARLARMSPDPLRPLQDAIVRLLKSRPFYGQFLLQFKRLPYAGNKAVAVTIADAIPTLLVNPQRFMLFAQAEQEALLEHLIKHTLHLHPCRRKERRARIWDLACDLAINPGIANLPREAVQPARLRLPEGLAAEEYYARLLQLPELGSLSGSGDDQRPPQDSGEQNPAAEQRLEIIDDHIPWQDADRTPVALSEQVVRQMVSKARQGDREESTGELATLLEPFLTPPSIPWQQVLRQFVGTAGRVGKSSTWSRSHRRFDRHTPGLRKKQYLNLVVAIDVSDSTDTQLLREAFANELLRIARGRQSRITVLYAGSRIQKVAAFSGQPLVVDTYRGGGFTDFRPAFEYAQQLQPRPAAMIYLTDGFGPAPASSDIPTLWVLSPEGRKPVPWGLELRLQNHCR